MNAFDILAIGINSIGCLLVGYVIGSHTGVKEIKEKVQEVFKDIKKSSIPSGVITRPSAAKVNKNQTEKEKEEEEEMKRQLEKLFPERKLVN